MQAVTNKVKKSIGSFSFDYATFLSILETFFKRLNHF